MRLRVSRSLQASYGRLRRNLSLLLRRLSEWVSEEDSEGEENRIAALEVKTLARLGNQVDAQWFVNYRQRGSVLDTLFLEFGTDRGNFSARESALHESELMHNYADFYDFFFSSRRDGITSVFECGIGSVNPEIPYNMGTHGTPGASLRTWRAYFPNATIHGADIDRSILGDDDRIKTAYMDQADPESVRDCLRVLGNPTFDVIIDDGLHEYEANICLFENSFHALRPGGFYIIEDIDFRRLESFAAYFDKKQLNYYLISLVGAGRAELLNNSLLVLCKSESVPLV